MGPGSQDPGIWRLLPGSHEQGEYTISAAGELGNSRTPPTTLMPTLLSLNPYATLASGLACLFD